MDDSDERPLRPEDDSGTTADPGDGAGDGVAGEGGDAVSSPRRRRRGRRGGRRHRRKDAGGEEQAAEAAGEPRAAPTEAVEPELAREGVAAGVVEPAKKRGARRRRSPAEAPAQAAEGVVGGEVAAAEERPAAEPAKRPRGRRRAKAAGPPREGSGGEVADASGEGGEAGVPTAAEVAPAAEAPPGAAATLEAAATPDSEAPAQHKKRSRRRRPTSAASPAEAPAAASEVPAADTAEPSPAVVGRRGEAAAEALGVDEASGPRESGMPKRRGHRGGRGRRKTLAAPDEGPAVELTEPVAAVEAPRAAPAPPETLGAAAAEGGEPAAPARRSRGGRRRRKVAGEHPSPGHGTVERGSELSADAPVAEGVTAALQAREEAGEEEEPARRGGRGRRQLPRVGAVEPELPEHKEMLVTVEGDELRVALVEDGRLAEIYIERPGKRSYAGNIYHGKVDNVIPGMDAAFVEIGLEKNGFLYVDEVAVDDEEKRPKHITEVLKPRQELLVQVMKDPMGSKGARLTGQLSLAGRYLVYVPGGSGVGVSRRLGAAERDRLRDLCKQLRPKKAGLIVRTVAEGKGLDELHRDLQYLSRLWSRLKARAEKIPAPGLLYEEADVSLQVARDLFNDTFEAVIVDDKKQRDKFVAYLQKEAPELADRVRPYEGEQPLFDAYGIEEQIAKALERRVRLPSGGNIVIDHTEAFTVIDVNTGRYTAGRNLEETITKTNLEAAREVVRQLRLRDIGGIIIIDFIDMAYARNREAVLAKLQAELDTDRTKTYVVEISPLGLVEMTRQNITDGARGVLTKECPSCSGRARIFSEDTAARNAVREVRRQAKASPHQAFLYEVNHLVGERIAGMGWLKALEKETGKHIFLEGSQALPVDTLKLIVAGTREDVERQRIPVREGQELEVELEHTLTYSPGDAVAHVDGYEITVLGGRPSLGKRRAVKVTSMSRTGAFATLMGKGRH